MITNVQDLNVNQGDFSTSGVDLALQYMRPTDFGRFLFRFNGTYLLYIRSTPFPNTTISGKGNYDLGVNPAVKFNLGVDYTIAGFNAGVLARYIGPFKECADSTGAGSGGGVCSFNYGDASGNVFPNHQVTSETVFDLYAGYRLKSPVGVTAFLFGVRNLFNTDPTLIYNSFLTYADPSAYDFVGRYFYGRVTQSF